ncbi:MAG: HD domain-containing protein [Verrucomicrobiales bacterium]|nr:HD domain-containing protein [Verrucomicrobiales bacterium]
MSDSQKIDSIKELGQQVGPNARKWSLWAQLELAISKTARSGSPYYELKFVDAEGSVTLRAWNDTPAFEQSSQLKKGDFFEIDAEWFYNAEFKSIEAKSWQLQPLDEEQIDVVLAGSAALNQLQQNDYNFIESSVAAIKDPRLQSLCQSFLDRFSERFRRTGAARDYHHARRGGLIEHVAQMMRSALKICEAYPVLNPDLLIAGVLFHDSGKLWENNYSPKGFTMPYSETGELIGHIPMGMELINKLWRDLLDSEVSNDWLTLEPPTEQVRLHLLHLIAAHHGEMAFGSPVVPKTPEAIALHYIDNLDAKMEMFAKGYQTAATLAPNVFDRVRPLPGKLIRPLGKFDA